MAPWLIFLVAIVSTTLCVFLWFREVRGTMRRRKSTVESADGQLVVCRERARSARDDPDAAAVLERSENIYRQAVDLYNRTLDKPWNYLPAHIMGFHRVS